MKKINYLMNTINITKFHTIICVIVVSSFLVSILFVPFNINPVFAEEATGRGSEKQNTTTSTPSNTTDAQPHGASVTPPNQTLSTKSSLKLTNNTNTVLLQDSRKIKSLLPMRKGISHLIPVHSV